MNFQRRSAATHRDAAENRPESEVSGGPHIRTVQSSDTLASMLGMARFQDTQLTVLVWPFKTSIGFSRDRCQM